MHVQYILRTWYVFLSQIEICFSAVYVVQTSYSCTLTRIEYRVSYIIHIGRSTTEYWLLKIVSVNMIRIPTNPRLNQDHGIRIHTTSCAVTTYWTTYKIFILSYVSPPIEIATRDNILRIVTGHCLQVYI